MDGSMNNINLANDGYEENQFNAQLVDNLNIDDFQEFIGKNQEDTGMAIENNNFSLYKRHAVLLLLKIMDCSRP